MCEARRRQMLATLVRLPEADGTVLELQPSATVRAVLAELGIRAEDPTREPLHRRGESPPQRLSAARHRSRPAAVRPDLVCAW
ncbi:hypothetical protein AB0I68_32210 [Streptomyces sp. NPDC050448]|uniref:hypothetical protein n=1 Tax=Streptomyces sp. NPDC050448 TaxID=3155404 RepID=UPI00342601A9